MHCVCTTKLLHYDVHVKKHIMHRNCFAVMATVMNFNVPSNQVK